MSTLKEIKTGQTVKVDRLNGEGALRQHFLDMGIIPGTEVTITKFAPMGDPMELTLHGYELTLRLADAELIEVTPVSAKQAAEEKKAPKKKSEHPGLGEGGSPAAGRNYPDVCTCGKSEQRQDDLVQPAYGLEAARRQFSGSNSRPQRRRDKGTPKHEHHRPAGYILNVAVHERGDSIAKFRP